jgi:hypothetical protein
VESKDFFKETEILKK